MPSPSIGPSVILATLVMTLAGCSEATTQSLSTQGGMSGPADPLKCSPPSIDLGELPQGGSGRGGFSLANRVDRTIEVARIEKLAVFDIYPRYAAELEKGPNMLNYRRYPLANIPDQYHELVKPFVNGSGVEVMDNELDAILGDLPGWYSDRHPNLAGYNVIADETAKYLATLLRERREK